MQIMVVDDDPAIREMLSSLLEDEGYSVVTAPHGRAALEYLGSGILPPKVILLDLMMPIMNGWQFREAQRQQGFAGIPVIVLSATERIHEECVRLDVAGCIPKPIDFDLLFQMLDRYVPTA